MFDILFDVLRKLTIILTFILVLVVEHPENLSVQPEIRTIDINNLTKTATRKEYLVRDGNQGFDWIKMNFDLELNPAKQYYRVRTS